MRSRRSRCLYCTQVTRVASVVSDDAIEIESRRVFGLQIGLTIPESEISEWRAVAFG